MPLSGWMLRADGSRLRGSHIPSGDGSGPARWAGRISVRRRPAGHPVVARRHGGLDGHRWRVVAGEVAGIHVETNRMTPFTPSRTSAQSWPAAFAAGLPAVHPLAVGVVLARHELGRRRVEHAPDPRRRSRQAPAPGTEARAGEGRPHAAPSRAARRRGADRGAGKAGPSANSLIANVQPRGLGGVWAISDGRCKLRRQIHTPVVLFEMVEKALQRPAPRPAEQAAVHADAQHRPGARRPRRRNVEGVAQVVELAAVESPGAARSACRCVEGCGHHQVGTRLSRAVTSSRRAGRRRSSRRSYATAVVGHQAGVGRIAAGAHTSPGAFAGEALDDLHADAHVLALGGFVDGLVVDPAPAVAGDLVAEFAEGGGEFGWRCSAIATPKTVSGNSRRSNSRRMRHTPTREPYS